MREILLIFLLISFCTTSYNQICRGSNQNQNTIDLTDLSIGVSADTVTLIEKVYLHTDRTCYYPGDYIWFKAYLVDAYERLLSGQSRNLHVELISPSSEIIASHVVRIDYGLGNGDFKLPDNVSSGNYRLRAYTNYMRNFSDQVFFNKEIKIIRSTASTRELPGNEEYGKDFPDLSFYPEGGSLVDDVASIVAFKAVDAEGQGCNVNGEVYSSEGEMVTEFKSTHLGMGTFVLKPLPGLSYFALVKGPGNSEIKSEMPKSFAAGLTLSASVNYNNKLSVTIRTNEQTLPVVLDHDLLLSISIRKEIVKTIRLRINSLSNSLVLPTDDLPDGIVMLTLTTLENLPLTERLLFLQRGNNLQVTIQPDKEVYKERDPVSVKVIISGDSTNQETAFLSLSAAESNFTDNPSEFPTNIASWFLLESDIHGTVEGPSWYFDLSNLNRERDIDLLLRTQGWRDFSWKYDSSSYFSPERGFFVSGRLRRLNTDKPLTDARVNFVIIQGGKIISEKVPVDASGRFSLDNIDITGDAHLVVSGVDKNDRPNGLILLDSVKNIPATVSDYIPAPRVMKKEEALTSVQDEEMKEKESVLSQEYELREVIRKKYKLSDTIGLGEVIIAAQKPRDIQVVKIETIRALYGEPDNEVIVTPQIEKVIHAAPELLMGTVAGVYVTGPIRGQYNIKFTRSMAFGGMSNNKPLLIIDGINRPLDYLNFFPVSLIDRIDVLKTVGRTAVFGFEGANGVISVITRSGDRMTTKTEQVKHSVNSRIKGYDTQRIFYSPRHDPATSDSFNPDLRTTLFWKPDINLPIGKELLLNYFNADNPATILIVVEGITSSGVPVTANSEYQVVTRNK